MLVSHYSGFCLMGICANKNTRLSQQIYAGLHGYVMETSSGNEAPGNVVFIRKMANLAESLVKAIFPLLGEYIINGKWGVGNVYSFCGAASGQ